MEQIFTTNLSSSNSSEQLYNSDLAPVRSSERHWTGYSLFAVWMNSIHNAAGYSFAAGLFIAGLSPIDVIIGLFLGSILLSLASIFSGIIGQETGVPYPVISRLSWGIWGANFPAIIRSLVAIAWYGIQTYLASVSLKLVVLHFIPALSNLTHTTFLNQDLLGWLSFLILSAIQLIVLWNGMEIVRKVQDIAGPIIWIIMLFLAIWLLSQAHWTINWTHSSFSGGNQVYQIFAAVGLTVGTFIAFALNFSDIARFVPRQKSVIIGNLFGVPLNYLAFTITSVVMSAAALKIYGSAPLDPAVLLSKINNNFIFLIGSIAFIFATIGSSIVTNFISAAYDISNINPKHIDFRRGGLIAGIIAILITPWNLYSSADAIKYFLGALGGLIGPFLGILLIDYYFIHKRQVKLDKLYSSDLTVDYYYWHGVNPRAIAAFIPAAILSLSAAFIPSWSKISPFGWLIGILVSGIIYFLISRKTLERT